VIYIYTYYIQLLDLPDGHLRRTSAVRPQGITASRLVVLLMLELLPVDSKLLHLAVERAAVYMASRSGDKSKPWYAAKKKQETYVKHWLKLQIYTDAMVCDYITRQYIVVSIKLCAPLIRKNEEDREYEF